MRCPCFLKRLSIIYVPYKLQWKKWTSTILNNNCLFTFSFQLKFLPNKNTTQSKFQGHAFESCFWQNQDYEWCIAKSLDSRSSRVFCPKKIVEFHLRHCDSLKKGQLTLSLFKMKKGDDIDDGDDDDAVRTNVSQDRWQRHCVLRNCFSGLGIYSPLHISDR
jgi:hypothetical protein